MPGTVILSLNSGSSSLKFALFDVPDSEPRTLYSGQIEGIGGTSSRFWIGDASGKTWKDDPSPVPDQGTALQKVAGLVSDNRLPSPQAIGHRIVHGGPNLTEHRRITPEVLQELEKAVVFAPLHLPVELRLIRLTESHFPSVPQFACFDTAFHRRLREEASRFALPEDFWRAGVRRYGFHGLSCESILHALGKDAPERIIIAHLGSGASVTAVSNGVSLDTTMGLTPTGGIVMGTRPGDLDPGVFLYLLREMGGNAESMFDRKCGLLGISGTTSDMRQLQARDDSRSRMAIVIFCRSVKKAIGSFFAVLGGLDLLVFAGGIGENDPAVRAQICGGLEPLGMILDPARNQGNLTVISRADSRAAVRIQHSDEEIQIARQTAKLLK
jgi:acetate kinase